MKMVPFPLNEIYLSVLVQGWSIRELWRKDGEICLCVYAPNPAMEEFIRKTGFDWEDAIYQTQHLKYLLYEDDEDE